MPKLRDQLTAGYGQEAARAAGLESLGYGSARETFVTPEGTALKVLMLQGPNELADNLEDDSDLQEAVSQMVNELSCLEATQGHPLVPRLVDAGRKDGIPLWIETELLEQPEAFAPAFERSTGVDWDDFSRVITDTYETAVAPTKQLAAVGKKLQGGRRFFRQLVSLAKTCPVYLLDLTQPDNWGFDASGQIKLLDLGIYEYRSRRATW